MFCVCIQDDGGMFSLLPGYNSRPNPSPEKARKRQRLNVEGGFTTHQTVPQDPNKLTASNVAKLESAKSKNIDSRLSRQMSKRTSVTSSLPSQPSQVLADSLPVGSNLKSSHYDEDEIETSSLGEVEKAKSNLRPGLQKDDVSATYDRKEVRQKISEASKSKEGGVIEEKKQIGDALWEELANELHASKQRRPLDDQSDIGLPAIPVAQNSQQDSQNKIILVEEDNDGSVQQETPKGKEKDRLERIQLRARNALLAHAGKDIASFISKSYLQPHLSIIVFVCFW